MIDSQMNGTGISNGKIWKLHSGEAADLAFKESGLQD